MPRHSIDMKGEQNQSSLSRPGMHGRAKSTPHNWHLAPKVEGPKALALKNHFIAMVGEYVGTVLFLLFALGATNVANMPSTNVTSKTGTGQEGTTVSTANTSNLLFIALAFGFSLAVNAWVFFRVSGGLFNPAVSLGMFLIGALTPLRAALLTVAQVVGGITGAAIVKAITPGTLNVRTTLSPGVSVVRGLFIEVFLTSLLMLAILLLAAEKHKATFVAPIGIGLALFVAELFGVYYTGGSLNPARSFGPSVVLGTFESYHWIYWLGPALGATIAAGFYKMLKYLQYETVLGPESDGSNDDVTTGPSRAAKQENALGEPNAAEGIDEERAIQSPDGRAPARMNVIGPGIGDLLTSGDPRAIWDLEHQFEDSRAMNRRLERMEKMLEGIAVGLKTKPKKVVKSTSNSSASPTSPTLPVTATTNGPTVAKVPQTKKLAKPVA